MTGVLTVKEAVSTTFQDCGRRAYAEYGVPTSGAWDLRAFDALNRLVTNAEYSSRKNAPAVMESLHGNLTLELSASTRVAFLGPASCHVNEQPVPAGTLYLAPDQSRMRIIRHAPGPIYVLIDGLHLDPTLGSVSFDSHSRIGTAPVTPGQRYPYTSHEQHSIGDFVRVPAVALRSQVLRFIPHDEALAEWVRQHKWKIAAVSRVGTHLTRIEQHDNEQAPDIPLSLPSYPTCRGLLQMPSPDRMIMLGPDCGTTGGYATAGTVITLDQAAIAYMHDEQQVSFAVHPVADAIAALDATVPSTRYLVAAIGDASSAEELHHSS